MAEQSALIKKRTVIKSACTRTRNYVAGIEVVTDEEFAQLKIRLQKLERSWDEYDQIQSEVEESLEKVDEAERSTFENEFFSLHAQMKMKIDSYAPNPPFVGGAPGGNENANNNDVRPHVRLPKVNLPRFTGKYDEWHSFYDAFQSMIHNNLALSNVERFQYLKTSLAGEASEIIQSIELTAENYATALTMLRERYDDHRMIIQNHVRAILGLPSVQKENLDALRQLVNGALKHVMALKALKRPTDQWDDLLLEIITMKLDNLTLREWQNSIPGNNPPTFKQLTDFLLGKCRSLSSMARYPGVLTAGGDHSKNNKSNPNKSTTHVSTIQSGCPICNGEHAIYNCRQLLKSSVAARINQIRKKGLCLNCLRSKSHQSAQCESGTCKICHKKHNTLLHLDKQSMVNPTNSTDNSESNVVNEQHNKSSAISTCSSVDSECVLLSTAVVDIVDKFGKTHPCRVLLDNGSQANFISAKMLNQLHLKPQRTNMVIIGINQSKSEANQSVKVQIKSRFNSFTSIIDCIVSEEITNVIPSFRIQKHNINIPKNIKLADSNFNIPSRVDLLIGADIFWHLICVGQIKYSRDSPILQKTQLGWIISGRVLSSNKPVNQVRNFYQSIRNVDLDNSLSKFWQLENYEHIKPFTIEERKCEDHFVQNVCRNDKGQIIVKLPCDEEKMNLLGNSKYNALKRLHSIERKFEKQPEFKNAYVQFMREYQELDHMRKIDDSKENDSIPQYYLPHHGIIKTSSSTTKLRVVFDGSSKTSTGISLNEALLKGPTIQEDLFAILIRFRTFKFVLTADIEKMYRQVRIHDSQTSCQRILWREDVSKPVETFELQTVTYGTTSAPFLAIRSLSYLAEQEKSNYPRGSKIINRDFYVDDLITGSNSQEELILIRKQCTQILSTGGFILRKWASNDHSVLEENHHESSGVSYFVHEKGVNSRTLGICWNDKLDTLHYDVSIENNNPRITKRTIISEISQIFDPLGLISPVVVLCKIIMQELWQLKIDWDASIPQNIHTKWIQLRSQLKKLNDLKIPRRSLSISDIHEVQLHGFCDASQQAFGACVYLQDNSTNQKPILLCAKSRVAPIRTTSLPRLELCAAVLLSQLCDRIKSALPFKLKRIILWSDSMVALAWIKSTSKRWNVFVANRVGEIQSLTNVNDWRHVPTQDNPADIVSRGVYPCDLCESKLWMNGPPWLSADEIYWPNSSNECDVEDAPERRQVKSNVALKLEQPINDLIQKLSSLSRLIRTIAYCLRFLKNLRTKDDRELGPLSSAELEHANIVLNKAVQKESFTKELEELKTNNRVSASNRICSLSPFLDENGLIRVGGRLKNSALNYSSKYPILLPRNHAYTNLIIQHEHIKNLHAGCQATLAAVRSKFWPLSARSTVYKITRECIICFKSNPIKSEAIMGNLPSARVQPSRPFSHCGIDYAGPLHIREGKRRNYKFIKCYIAIFVCFSTKAVHIELVSDLSAESFIATFKRFMARRGKVQCMYSDNGTNFVGANRELNELYDALRNEQIQNKLHDYFAEKRINWSFIPPAAPHMGGLWEAGVKSAKLHLKRIIGEASLTFEEMYTVLCEIESVLNSRPITALLEDPNDFAYLTPGHFLIGDALNSAAQPTIVDLPINRLSRWQRIEQIRQQFWKRWSSEYLQLLQNKTKWKANRGVDLKVGHMVLIQQSGSMPLQWCLGRITTIHIGTDGVARSADVLTNKGEITRPLVKLALLPFNSSEL